MMNIAIISTNKNKYSETFIHNHIKLLPASIHFLFDGYLPKQYSTDKGLNSFSMLDFYKPKWYLFNKPKFKNETEHLHVAIEYYLIKNKIDLIFCEYGPSGVEMLAIAKKTKIPLLVHFHGYDAYRNDILNSYGKYYQNVFNYASDVVGVSKHMCSQLIALGCAKSKLHYLPYGIDINLFQNKKKRSNDLIMVSCGRFVEKKSPTNTIKAFSKVLQHIPNAKLIMIGDGELLDECILLAKTLTIDKNIDFKGILKQEEIAGVYHQSTVFVQHSITTSENDSEGTPVAILEAMACRLAIVSTKHGGIIDVVTDGETGFLVEENNVDGMADKMIYLATHPELAKEMGEKGRNTIVENYTLENYTKKLMEIIQSTTI